MKLTEQDIHRIVKESINRLLNESGNMDYYDVNARILKESPKAYYVAVKYYTQKGLSEKDANMWCPKSCCIVDNNRNITKIAKFILDRWLQDYYNFLKSKGYKSSPIDFNIANLQNIVDKKKSEKDEYQKYQDEVFSKLLETIKPIIEKNVAEIGPYSKLLGEYLLNNGLVPSDKCQNLIQIGDILIKNFGARADDEAKRILSNNPNREELYNITNQYGDIIYGFSVSRQIDITPKNVKYSASEIIDNEIKCFQGYYGKKQGKLYKMFKKHVDLVDKFNDVAFDALNTIKR
jgi:hypothetical protein